MAKKPRNYRLEYKQTDGRPQDIKERTARNRARREAMKKGLVKKGDGKQIDHRDFNPLNNSPSNLRVLSKKANISRQPKRGKKK